MTYTGLTTADKGALLDAIKYSKSGERLTRIMFLDSVGYNVNIDLALAQIAEMESKQNNAPSEIAIEKGCTFCCYTEYPDTKLYPRDKSEFFATRSKQIRVDVFDEDELDDVSFCPNCGRNLNSPYTEGETDEG